MFDADLNELNFKLMANHSPFMIWVSNEKGKCIWFNQTWLNFSGKKLADELGMGWASCIHDDDRDRIALAYADYFKKRNPFQIEYRLKRHDNQYRWILDHGVPLFDEHQQFKGYVGSCIDINDKIESEKMTQRILDIINDGYWEYLPEDNVVQMSPRYWEMLGYDYRDKKDFLEEWQKIILPEDKHKLDLALERNFKSHGEIPIQEELRFYHREGHICTILCRGKTLEWSSDGKALRVAGVHTDVTEIKKTQQQLINHAKLVELGELSAGIAHEINNPLTVITARSFSMLKMLDKNIFDSEKLKSGILQISRMAQRISKIVDGLKHFSRNCESDLFEEISLDHALEDSIEILHDRLKHNSINLTLNSKLNTDTVVMGKSTQIMQVLVNLLGNSIDSITKLEERWINLSIIPVADVVEIRITDSGNGIPPQIVEKLFEPFFTTKSLGKGTGLGLSLSKRIIELHHGELVYDSTSPNTCFVISLPAKV